VKITVKVDSRPALKIFGRLAGQMNFTMARTLTDMAQAGQQEVRASLPGKFTLRNNWVSNGIRVRAARKNALSASVYTLDDFMALQESGGMKQPRGHGIALRGQDLGVPISKILRGRNRPRAKRQLKSVFVLGQGDQRMIAQRAGRQLKILFRLVPKARVKARLDMVETVQRQAGNLDQIFTKRLADALRSSR